MTRRSGLVLAGGRSRRFGRTDKALAEIEGEVLLRRVVERVSAATDEVIVSCRGAQRARFDRALADAPVDGLVTDRHADVGPLAGIEAGLDAAAGRYAAVVACDMPFVDPAVLDELFEVASAADAAVPAADDGLQPVQAVYRTRAMRAAVARLLPEGASVHEALDALDVVPVPVEALSERSFRDVNTRADLAAERRRHSLRRSLR